MCGICGVYGDDIDKHKLKRMNDTISHRGKDDEGYYYDTKIGMGHKRLSIIDVDGGRQPIHNEDETVWIIFNGEIYNFKDLRLNLEKTHRFYTDTDTETIVHCYEEYGLGFVSKLNGMFAFALWDGAKKRLVLARDHIGKKPLYYYDGNKFVFASEIKAILNSGIKTEIDTNGLYSYLACRYVPGCGTMFKNIQKVLPGNMVVLDNNKINVFHYWSVKENVVYNNEDIIIKTIRTLLENSAKYRMVSDVPIGAFLSGGIDSSAVVALSKPHATYEFHTFSLGFETYTELDYAKKVSDYVGTTHHEIILSGQDVLKNIEKITYYNDEPLGDASIINLYFLSKEAKKHVKVVLSGDGNDEIYAGYPDYNKNIGIYNILKSCVLNRGACFDTVSRLLLLERSHSDRDIKNISLLRPTKINYVIPNNITRMKSDINKMLAVDCNNLLPEKFLMKLDKSTMSNGIEARTPLLDVPFVEFAFTIPPSMKLTKNEKYLFKMAVKDLLPSEIVNRTKSGFKTPISQWINNDIKDDISKELKENQIMKIYFKTIDTERITDTIKWTLYTLCKWYNVYFNNTHQGEFE